MVILHLIVGSLLLVCTCVEVLWTTLSTQGAAPVTGRFARGLWALSLRLPGAARRKVMPAMGTLIVILTLGLWIVALWTGWYLVFAADSNSVVESLSGKPVHGWTKAYFVGFCVFTLGVGDYVAGNDGWRMTSVIASGSGLTVVTLSITYLVPVVSAATAKRQLAALIASFGPNPHELLLNGWDGQSFKSLFQRIADLQSDIEAIHQKHGAYPVLHYFHSSDRREELALMLASLDEALQLLRAGVAEQARPDPPLYQPLRVTIKAFLAALHADFVPTAGHPPPLTGLQRLREAGVPVVADASYEAAVQADAPRRSQLRGFVDDAGWAWADVLGASGSSP